MHPRRGKGKLYSIAGLSLTVVTRAVESTLLAEGFEINHPFDSGSNKLLHGRQKAPWYEVLLKALGQIVVVNLRTNPDGETISVSIQRKWFVWYKVLVLILALPAGYFWMTGFSNLFKALDSPGAITLSTLIVPWVGVLLMLALARMMFSERAQARLITRLKARVGEEGAFCEASSGRFSNPQVGLAALFLFIVTVCSIPILVGIDTTAWTGVPTQIGLAVIVCILLCMMVAGIWALIVSVRRFGADDRFAAVAAGLLTSSSLLFPVTGQMSFRLLGQTDHEFWSLALRANRLYDEGTDPVTLEDGTSVTRQEIAYGLSKLRLFIGFLVSLAALISVTGLYLLYKGLRGSKTFLEYCKRVHAEIDTKSGRAAASATGFLGEFRTSFGVVWLLFSILLLTAFISMIEFGIQAAASKPQLADPKTPVGAVLASIRMSEFLLGFHDKHVLIEVVGRLVWFLAASLIPALIVLSVMEHVRRRRATLRRLRKLASAPISANIQNQLQDQVVELVNKQFSPPRVVVTQSSQPFACAHEFGWRHPAQFIEISTGTVDLLLDSELMAVLGHELAHLIRGHTRKHNLLQLMARLTLVGGAFAGALENSFGYEQEADEMAVRRLGIVPSSLQDALIKLQVGGWINREEEPRPVELSKDQNGLPNNSSWRSWWLIERCLPSIQAWWTLYSADTAFAYWHPSVKERVSKLENENRGTI